ncbi:ABC transporter ATP-binding protein [Rathayibacter toxicus]|nr:ATP-binding cassette domain-containing protein [Rathayibacter toxicus]
MQGPTARPAGRGDVPLHRRQTQLEQAEVCGTVSTGRYRAEKSTERRWMLTDRPLQHDRLRRIAPAPARQNTLPGHTHAAAGARHTSESALACFGLANELSAAGSEPTDGWRRTTQHPRRTPMTTPVSFNNFSKSYGGDAVVSDVSFSVASGSIVGLLGPNGAGKSTTLRGLVGVLHPSSGTATVFGTAFTNLANPARKVGVHMDGLGFETGITARRHLEIYRLAAGMPRARVDEVLEQVDLAAHASKRVKKLSTGMRQRLGLATALIGDPELLVLDEPANGLDPSGIRWLRGFLRSFAARGGTVLISSHQLAELEQTIDEVVVLRRRVLYSGPLATLTSGGASSLEEGYFDLIDAAEGGALRG